MLLHKMVYFWAKALLGLALGPSIHALHSSRAWELLACDWLLGPGCADVDCRGGVAVGRSQRCSRVTHTV